MTVAAVARRLGVAPATLRTWDRRYGLGPSERLAGSHRRYSTSDVSRLLVMRRLTLEGVAPSEAARAALETPAVDSGSREQPMERGRPVSAVVDAFADAGPMAPDPPALVAAATHFDNAAVRWMLARVHSGDVIAWWTRLVGPALTSLAEEVVVTGPGESPASALSAAAFAELRSRAAVTTARSSATAQEGDSAPVVLAVGCDPHADLVVHVLAAALREHGVQARVLSVARPEAVADAVRRLRPDAIAVHVGPGPDGEVGAAGVAAVAAAVDAGAPGSQDRDETPVFVHLEGAARVDLPVAQGVHRVRTLTGALHEILAVVH